MSNLDATAEGEIPGLLASASHKAYEMKFAVQETQISEIADWARANLDLDQHADRFSETYNITSLYFDTSDWDVYNNCPGYKLSKYRVRRYDSEPLLFLEVKSRRGRRVAKHRVRVPLSELSMLKGEGVDPGWPGFWFYQGLFRRQLKPSVLVAYRRAAYVREGDKATPRLTLDTRLFCAPAVGYSFAHPKQANFFIGRAVLELKYRGSMPDYFWTLIRKLDLQPSGISKYRLAVAATELAKIP